MKDVYNPAPHNRVHDENILRVLEEAKRPLRVREVGAAIDFAAATASKRLLMLVRYGFLVNVGTAYSLPQYADPQSVTPFGANAPPEALQQNCTSSDPVGTDAILDDFVAKFRGVPLPQAIDALHGLDVDFVKAVLERLLGEMDDDSRRRILKLARRMENEWRPRTDEELHDYIKKETGLLFPRKSVCQGHCSPFEFMADCYFERGNPDKLAVGNRGSGKTQIMGTLNGVNVETKPRYTACTIGAVEAQAQRAYGYFRDVATTNPKLQRMVKGKVLMGGTEFTNGSKVEIVVGTITGVNSPHPIFAHWDEVELLRPGVFDEGLNMAQSKNGYQAMNVLTSSWKKPKGFVSGLIDDEIRAKREHRKPAYQIYRWCVWETTAPCPHDCNACPFADDIKGVWEDGTPRSFESACKRGSPDQGTGKLKYTDGFVTVQDAVVRFRKLPRRVWEAQQESKRPTLEGLVYDVFEEDMHTVEGWSPDPDLGPCFVGVDFGGTNPHAAVFAQRLAVEVNHKGRRIPEGAYVIFDEVYVKDVGNVEFGRRINERINLWASAYPSFAVSGFYRDPAAKAAALDLRRLSSFGSTSDFQDIPTSSMGKVEVEGRIGLVYELITKNRIFVDRIRCENFMNEIGGYEYKEGTTKPVKEDDHLMDAWGYLMWNLHAKDRKRQDARNIPHAQRRPRAVDVRAGKWDPAALGTVPQYGTGGGEPDDEPTLGGRVGIVPRIRDIGF